VNTDHCLVTNFEGTITIYRGLDLEELIRDVATAELEYYPEELASFLSTDTLDLNNLEYLLEVHDTELYYDAPRTY